MAFGMSPFPLRFGSRQGGGGDPTAITPANADAFLASLGLTQAGTGTTWGETGQVATPLYAVAAAKIPLAVETIAGKKYFGPIVNPAGTNLALYSSDGTNAAWVKTSCTAALALGGLEHNADWEGPELASSFSPPYNMSDGKLTVIFGQTFPTATAFIVTVDLTYGGVSSVKATFFNGVVNSWSAPSSIVASTSYFLRTNGAADRFVLQNIGTPTDTIINSLSIKQVDAHSLVTATGNNATALQSITSTSGERVSKFWLARGSGSGAISLTQDNGSTWADVTLTDDPQPFNVAAATLANPVIGIRITTSGDSVRLYGVQHQVASRPLRPYIGPTAGSTVTAGAGTLLRTGLSGITEVDVEIASLIPPSTSEFLRTLWIGKASDNINRRIDISYNAGTLYVILNGATALNQAMPASDPFKIRIQQSTTGGYSVTLNDGTPITGAENLATDIDALAIGAFQNGEVRGEQPTLAIRCNLLDGLGGWNHQLLDNWA